MNVWIPTIKKMPEPGTDCIVTILMRDKRYEYDSMSMISEFEDIDTYKMEFTEGGAWGEPTNDYYLMCGCGSRIAEMLETKMNGEVEVKHLLAFPKGSNRVEGTLIYGPKRKMVIWTRELIVKAWYEDKPLDVYIGDEESERVAKKQCEADFMEV